MILITLARALGVAVRLRVHGSTVLLAALTTAVVSSLGTALSVGVVTTTAAPAYAAASDAPTRVTVMGTLMDELGCASDWDEAVPRPI